MRNLFYQYSWKSLRVKLILAIVMLIFPLILLLYYIIFYATEVVHEQVAKSNKNMISLYMRQIDQGLNDVNGYLLSLTYNPNMSLLANSETNEDYFFAKQNLFNQMTAGILNYKSIDSMFIYNPEKDDLIDVFYDRTTFVQRDTVMRYIRKNVQQENQIGTGNSWSIKQIGDEYYVFHAIPYEDLYIGAWVNVKSLHTPLEHIELGDIGATLFTTSTGIPMVEEELIADNGINLNRVLTDYFLSGDKEDFLVVGESSKVGPFNLVAVVPDRSIVASLPFLNKVIFFMTAGLLIIIPCFFFFLRKILLVPLKRLLSTMKLIGEGNLNIRIKEVPTSDEFVVVNRTFNQMMEQIENLKIKVYEEQINKQKAELQHLQSQINPHFFMNSLNILYSLALVKNFDLIKEMTMCLVRYFRFMYRSNLIFVPLADEIEHVRNYLRIQELRFPQSLKCQIHVPQYLEHIHIPPLFIQTFVENTIKHAVTLDEPVHLQVGVEMDKSGEEPHIHIVIQDSGRGFTEQVLNELRAGNRIVDEQGDHIGIWNVKHRLRLLYQDRATITFRNAVTNGATIEMKIPVKSERFNEGGEISA